ncbi:hypothetical protein JOM56_011130 [Amanita muscaria]
MDTVGGRNEKGEKHQKERGSSPERVLLILVAVSIHNVPAVNTSSSMKIWHQDHYLNHGLHLLILLPLLFHHVFAVTVYRKDPSPTSLAPGAIYSGPAAFNPIMLQAPAPPSNFATQLNITVRDGPAPLGSSIQQLSSFFGFSIEMSVVDEVRK